MKYQATGKVVRRMALMAFRTEYRYGKPVRETRMILVDPGGCTEDTEWDLNAWVKDGYLEPLPEPAPVAAPVALPEPAPQPAPVVETVAPPAPSPPGQRVLDSKPSPMRNVKPNLGAPATPPVPLEGMEDGLADMGFKVAVQPAPVPAQVEEIQHPEALVETVDPVVDPEPAPVVAAPKPKPRLKRPKVSPKRKAAAKPAPKESTDEG